MRSIHKLAIFVLVLSMLLCALPNPGPIQATPPPPQRQSGASESQADAIQISPRSGGHSGVFALTDSPEGNYAPNVDVSAQISQAFDLQGASTANLTFWHRYYLGPASALIPHSGSYVLTDSPFGDYSNYADISAQIAQAFDLSTVGNPHLTFWHYYEIESGYDYLRVEASTDGSNWTVLASYTGYQYSYTQADIDLSGYVGQPTVYLRFHLQTDYSVIRDGWVMDDLLFKDGTNTLFSDGFEAGADAWLLDPPWDAVSSNADQASVQVSLDGTTWSDLAVYQGEQDAYTQVYIDLSAYLGEPSLRVRWRLISDDTDEYDGWYVDDLALDVSGNQVFGDDFESGTGSWSLDPPWGLTVPNTLAYLTSNSSGMATVLDDLEELRIRGGIPDYDVFAEDNINDLWANLDQYSTLLMEEDIVYEWSNPCDPSCEAPIPVTEMGLSIYNHRQQLGQWIYDGGGLFVTDENDVSDYEEMYWAWLPDDLLVKSKTYRDGYDTTDNLYAAYDPGLFSYPNDIDVTVVDYFEAHGEFVSFPGYTAMVRDSVTDDVLEIYRYYGAGVIVLSHLEYETANYDCGDGHTCDANYVENEFHFLRVSVETTAIYPNSNGNLDIFATATSSALGELIPGNTQSVTYEIRDEANVSTGITGTLSYDANEAHWGALDVDISGLNSGIYFAMVTFVDTAGNTGSGLDEFGKGLPYGELGISTPNARDGDTVMIYATLWDEQGLRITNSDQLTVTLAGVADPFRLYDDGTHGDLRSQDGEYSIWQDVNGSGDLVAMLYYRGEQLDQSSMSLINDPELIVVTDIEDLHNEFLDTGTGAQEDQDANGVIDFYDLLERLNEYAAAYRGIVYDLSHEITVANGYASNYSSLDYGGNNNNTNRFQMMRLIDRFVEQIDLDTQQNGEHTIDAFALIGDDEVIPFYRRDDPVNEERHYGMGDNPTMVDSAADFLMTDVPYATFSDADPANDDQPQPDVPVGRVFAQHPHRLISLIDSYDTRIRMGDDISNASLFHLAPDTIDWPWLADNVQVPVLSAHYQAGNINNAPPFDTGRYYRYNGTIVSWRPISVTTALPTTDLVLLYSHADHYENTTQSGTDLDAADYDGAADSAENVLVNGGCHSGFSLSHNSPSNNFFAFDNAMVNSILDKRVAYFAPSTYGWYYTAPSNGLTPLLTQAFFDRALNATTPTIGDAWSRAYQDYWTASGSGGGHVTSVAYGTLLYGLPTQPIEHVEGSAASVRSVAPVTQAGAGPEGVRELTLSVDVPNFTVDFDARGAALARAGNGGSTFAEPYGPVMPQVLQRFVLPLEATDITIVENVAAREGEFYGTVELRRADPVNTQNDPVPGTFPIPSPYPQQSFWFDTAVQKNDIMVTLSAVPAQYEPTGELTLFTHMEFDVGYTLPTPEVSIDEVALNNGQPLEIGQASLPLTVFVTTPQDQSLSLQLEVVDPSGMAIESVSQIVTVLAGSYEINLYLDSERWTPGPKTLWVAVGNEDAVLDSRVLPFSAAGIRVDVSAADPVVAPGATVPLTIAVRDEHAALVGGLADRIAITVDGASVQPTVTEETTGAYRADLVTANLDLGMHQVMVQATDLRGICGHGIVEFAIEYQTRYQSWLPLILKNYTPME